MATISQSPPRLDHEGTDGVEDKEYPGYRVDVLLEQGKIEEARSEFERLVLKGVDSGPAIEVTPEFWATLHAEIESTGKPR